MTRQLKLNLRCGDCKLFKGNGKKCKDDSLGRSIIYAADYKCDTFQEVLE